METKSIDEYKDINDEFIVKAVRLKNLTRYIEKAINRLCDARISNFQVMDFSWNYESSHNCQIKEMALQRWILRYHQELKK